jgi:GDPmannose 4,6-dehydratase
MKTALITGIFGQDGAYLSRHLLGQGYNVVGTSRRSGSAEPWRLRAIGVLPDVSIVHMDLLELTNICKVIETYCPDEIYNLGAQSFVAPSFDIPVHTVDVNTLGTFRLLEAVRKMGNLNSVRFYQASSSEMFGKVRENPQSEDTPFHPRSPYGVSKAAAHWAAVNYRESYDMFVCCGILFNHESELRGAEFVTRKITRAVANIHNNKQQTLTIGNPGSLRDWGHAEDYVRAMHLMMSADVPSDYVIATGYTHSVQDFIATAFLSINQKLLWEGEGTETKAYDKNNVLRVEVSKEFYRPAEVDLLRGDASKAKAELEWVPSISFEELVRRMVSYDLNKTLHETSTPIIP